MWFRRRTLKAELGWAGDRPLLKFDRALTLDDSNEVKRWFKALRAEEGATHG